MKSVITYFCVALWSAQALGAGLWVVPKGEFHTSFSLTGAQWDQFLQRGSEAVALPGEITQYEISAYGEYSPIENLAFDASFPIVITEKKFVYAETDEQNRIIGVQAIDGKVRDVDTNVGIGDLTFGGRYIFWEKHLTVGSRVHIKFPGTYEYGSVVNSPGDGQTDMGLALLLGTQIPQARLYFRGSVGLVYRFSEPGNQLELMIEPGVNITRSLAGRFLYQHIEQFKGEDIQYYGVQNYYPAVEEDTDRIGFGLAYQATERLGFFAHYQQTIFGKNTANIKALTFGVNLSF